LSIKGVVKDDQGNVAPGVSVQLTVYGQAGGFDIGVFGNWFLYTDEKGDYSFMNLLRLERGHYEVWFNGGKEYGKVFENSGYYIQDNEISVDTCLLNVIVHPVTGSTFSGVVQYQDVDDSIKSFYSPAFPKSEPGHVLSIVRGTPNKPEYNIGAEYYKITGNTTEWQGLAGGTYFLEFTYRRMDGVLVNCKSPSFEIPPGQTRHFEYTIQDCPPVPVSEPVLP